MISKRKLKERLLDICNGAGYVWQDEDKYFEPQEGTLEDVGRVIIAIERAFDLPGKTRLRYPWYLKEFNDIDTLVELVHNALEFDIKGTT